VGDGNTWAAGGVFRWYGADVPRRHTSEAIGMTRFVLLTALLAAFSAPLCAQSAAVPADPQANSEDDRVVLPVEPDFTVVSLPTSLRLAQFASAFRVTHRFARPLEGQFSDLAADLFGLDAGAQIGLEYRFGLAKNVQAGIHRTSDRTIELFGEIGLMRQTPTRGFDVTALVSVDGTDNFSDRFAPALGAIVSRRFKSRAAVYVEPVWVHHASLTTAGDADSDVFMIGVAGRVRILRTVSLAGEYSPRLKGDTTGTIDHAAVALEKRMGGHVFQINVSDSSATTMGQVARGGPDTRDWRLGFNISRKFY
jgi:hypothetical protein